MIDVSIQFKCQEQLSIELLLISIFLCTECVRPRSRSRNDYRTVREDLRTERRFGTERHEN